MTVPEFVQAGQMPIGVRAATPRCLRVKGSLHSHMPDSWGWVLVFVELFAGFPGALTEMTFNAPSDIIVVASALVGAALAIVGAMTMGDEVERRVFAGRGSSVG